MSPPAASESRSLFAFVSLVFGLSIPFYVAGAVTDYRLLPGLPVSALALVCPMIAALILIYRRQHAAGVMALLRRSFEYRRIKPKWYLPILFLMPCVTVAGYAIMRSTGLPLPAAPRFALLTAPVLFAVLFVAALAEELGWSGYAIEALQARWSALASGVLLGIVWAVWHAIPLIEVDRSLDWMSWWALGGIASRVLMTWLFNNTGKSVFGVALFHTSINFSWQMFPNQGSHWDPRINALIVTGVAALVTVLWVPQTLAGRRNLGREHSAGATHVPLNLHCEDQAGRQRQRSHHDMRCSGDYQGHRPPQVQQLHGECGYSEQDLGEHDGYRPNRGGAQRPVLGILAQDQGGTYQRREKTSIAPPRCGIKPVSL